MSNYPQRVRENILPLSIGTTLPEAFEERSFTERTIDHEHATETCQLCEQESIRYHFEIRSSLTQHALLVGSQCILKFRISIFENGRRLSEKDSRKKLDRLTQKMRLDACIRSLEKVASAEANPILSNALQYYRKNEYLSPKYAFVVLWQLKTNNIDHNPSFFKINLRLEKYKNDLRTMRLSHIHAIWPALSSSQREMAIRFGHKAPN